MNIYLENVLRGFITNNSYVELNERMRDAPDFLLVDTDQDDMPEIVVCFREDEEDYIGILKRKSGLWILKEIKKDKEEDDEGIRSFIRTTESKKLKTDAIGDVFNFKEVFDEEQIRFTSIIDNKIYYGSIDINRQEGMADQEILDIKQADVFGSGIPDTIYLIGDRPYGEASQLAQNIKLMVKGGSTDQVIEVSLPQTKGYYPNLFVGDFTGDKRKDILITIYTGEGSGSINTYLYTFENNEPKIIFDSDTYNEKSNGVVEYKEGYKVKVTTQNPPTEYMLDVSENDSEYISKIYDEDGNLIEETFGEILGLISLNPIDYERSGVYSLDAIQTITGPDGKDTLGLLETFLVWDRVAKKFEPFIQYVSLYGKPAMK